MAIEGNPSTGYTWAVVDGDPAIIKQIGEPQFKAATANLAGSLDR